MLNLAPLPKAWMGYVPAKSGASRACVRVCSYCPDRREAEKEAERANHDVTHGICPSCYQREIAKLTGDTSDQLSYA